MSTIDARQQAGLLSEDFSALLRKLGIKKTRRIIGVVVVAERQAVIKVFGALHKNEKPEASVIGILISVSSHWSGCWRFKTPLVRRLHLR
jgi:hypothetical protein